MCVCAHGELHVRMCLESAAQPPQQRWHVSHSFETLETDMKKRLSAQFHPGKICLGTTKQSGDPNKAGMAVLLIQPHIHNKGRCLKDEMP